MRHLKQQLQNLRRGAILATAAHEHAVTTHTHTHRHAHTHTHTRRFSPSVAVEQHVHHCFGVARAPGVDVTQHTLHVTRHTSHVTRHTLHVTRHTSHVTRHTSHVTRHTSHVTRHTSHVTHHTSHVTRVSLAQCPLSLHSRNPKLCTTDRHNP